MNEDSQRHFPWLSVLALVCAACALVLAALMSSKFNKTTKDLETKIREAEWSGLLAAYSSGGGDVEPTVGTIAFIRQGFSIEFQEVTYSNDGLHLSGYVGNPTNLTVRNLTLTVIASKNRLAPTRDEFMKDKQEPREWVLNLYHPQIGTAQSAMISVLKPAGRERFAVTVPNVKQSSEGIHLEVRFSGSENYAYF